jgi:hypothetical protein
VATSQAHLADGDLAVVAAQLAAATTTRDVFGELGGTTSEQLDQLRRVYRQLALCVHPDRHQNDPAASKAFVQLQRLYATAQAQLGAGRYGDPSDGPGTVTIRTRRRTYTVGAPFAMGMIANLYTATVSDGRRSIDAVLKVAREPADNDLLANEASALRQLTIPTAGRPIPAYIPRLLESFAFRDAVGQEHQANAFPLVDTERGPLPADQFFSLKEIRDVYTDGVDAKQMAWMWRRLLLALSHAHERAVIHGAVLPTHVLIHPEAHGLLLIDWCAGVQQPGLTGGYIPVIDAEYAAWYQSSVLAKVPPTPAVDLEMSLRCMVFLLGGDPLTGAVPPRGPVPIQTYLQSALRSSPVESDARQLYRDFADLLAAHWGRRRFTPFAMPARR